MSVKKEVLIKLHRTKRKIFREVEKELSKSRRKRASVNVEKIYRMLKNNEKAVVPGKVIGALSPMLVSQNKKNVSIIANSFSKKAQSSLIANGIDAKTYDELSLEELKNLKTGLRLIK
ncbi:MAG: hypothetical protein N3E37_04705 [Candidatus Micrarchaeota archaeon]|nr:hypothetical protein [Candidatus Micrarchaeota archaeon]